MSPNSMEVMMSMSLVGATSMTSQFPASMTSQFPAYAGDEVKYSTLDWPPSRRRVSASVDCPR